MGGSGLKLNFREAYRRYVGSLMKKHPATDAMELAVGGSFRVMGVLERELLIHYGLRKDGYVIDVGCGSGRLAKPLSEYLTGKYLGIDVVPELLDHARELVGRRDWRFEDAAGLSIPEADGKADMVCFFSVFTHLLHEQSYVYLEEAKRVLKSGGIIVFSFLDFSMPNHWPIFESNVKAVDTSDHPLNMFMSRDAVEAWASHLGLRILDMKDADKPCLNIVKPVRVTGGGILKGEVKLGQSLCVLSRP